MLFGPADRVPAGLLGRYGVTEVYVVEPAALDGYAPQAWARTLEGLLSVTLAGAVVAAGTDCGSEVLAHLGALTGQPMAANCISAERAPSSAAGRHAGRVPAALGRAAHRGRHPGGDAGPAHRGHRCRSPPACR